MAIASPLPVAQVATLRHSLERVRAQDDVEEAQSRRSVRGGTRRITASSLTLALSLLLLCVMTGHAQQLSLRRYDVSDGLAHNTVTSIYQDKKGYLWFTTFEGLSRFDGYRFTTYDTRDGLGHTITNHVIEDRQGRLWVATNGGGVSRLRDDPREEIRNPKQSRNPKSATHDQAEIHQLSRGRDGWLEPSQPDALRFARNLWCLTNRGLYRAGVTDGDLTFEAISLEDSLDSHALLEDRQGRLWFGLAHELIEVRQNHVINHGPVGGAGRDLITGIVQDRQGRLLVASYHGPFEFIPPTGPGQGGKWLRWPRELTTSKLI